MLGRARKPAEIGEQHGAVHLLAAEAQVGIGALEDVLDDRLGDVAREHVPHGLALDAPGMPTLQVPFPQTNATVPVNVWKSDVAARPAEAVGRNAGNSGHGIDNEACLRVNMTVPSHPSLERRVASLRVVADGQA